MTTNPLNDYFRKPEVSVRLPAGTWYHNGEVDFNMSGEVDVYSMLPADEIMLTNPDALVTGTAIAEILKSCVPAVKRPEDLYSKGDLRLEVDARSYLSEVCGKTPRDCVQTYC